MTAATSHVAIDWPAPPRVRALVTTRMGGASRGPYASFNLATHCGDDAAAVRANRRALAERYGVPDVAWLDQVHGAAVVEADPTRIATADASFTRRSRVACAILTADCLPVLICDRTGSVVGAAHCGWRGLASRVLSELVARLAVPPSTLLAWLGPAISQSRYEIGNDVRDAMLRTFPRETVDAALRPAGADRKWHADLYALARAELGELGVGVHGGHFCTYDDARFYSYRRDGTTGRTGALIWLE